ncbi:MAG TPA: hypothetical protein DCG72_12320 [Gammaproteobacteria bacterium]|nr:hypothetical protein [Gammaproteobacteria bacterium]
MEKELRSALLGHAWTTRHYIKSGWEKEDQKAEAYAEITALIDTLIAVNGASGNKATEEAPKKAPVAVPPVDPVPNYAPPEWLYDESYFPVVGRRFSPGEFAEYLKSSDLDEMKWSPEGITIHHTAAPNLSQRPNGFEEKHMGYLRSYYKGKLGWSRGPHLFVDDHGIWVFSPLSSRGIHAKSFNASRIGIEMLGDFSYDDDPFSGRGEKVLTMSKLAAALLMKYLGISPGKLNFHRHDPLTSKDCPGKKIEFDDFEEDVLEMLETL